MFRAHDKAMSKVVWSKHSAQLRLISYFTSEETSYIFLPLHPIEWSERHCAVKSKYILLSIPTKVKLKPDYLLFQFTQCQSALKHLCYRIIEYIGQRDSKSAYLFTLPQSRISFSSVIIEHVSTNCSRGLASNSCASPSLLSESASQFQTRLLHSHL